MRKNQILDAAKNLMWDIGYEAMSPRKVMDQSGAGQGSLYHHFRGKEALASAALDAIADELIAAIDQIFDKNHSPKDQLRAYLLMERDGLKGCRIGRLGNERQVINSAELQQHLGRYFKHVSQRIETCLKEAKADGTLPASLKPKMLATTIMASIQGGYVVSRATQDPAAITRAAKGMLALLDALHA